MIKKYILPLCQAAVTILLLWWIFRDPEKNRAMLGAVSKASGLWLGAGVLTIGVACVLQTWRWRLLLSAQGIAFGWIRALRVYMIGLFFNLFMLGATGGDVVKIYFAMRETSSKKSAALLSVLVDRMMGLLGLIAVTVAVLVLRRERLQALLASSAVMQGLFGTLVLVMGGMTGLVVFGFLVDRFHLARHLPRWLPLRERIVELAGAFSVYARDGRTLAATFAISVICHLFNFGAFWCAARALGAFGGAEGLLDIFFVMPIILTITALPISLSGVGVREGLFEQMFRVLFPAHLGIAVPVSLLGFFMMVFWGVIGGIIYLLYRPSGGLDIRKMRGEISEVESGIEETSGGI